MLYAPDLIIVNANVLTMDPARPRATAVAGAGRRADRGRRGRRAGSWPPGVSPGNVIDLKGATLIPGFHDAHNHMLSFGLSLTEVDLRADSLDELYARVAARVAATPAGEWIIGASRLRGRRVLPAGRTVLPRGRSLRGLRHARGRHRHGPAPSSMEFNGRTDGDAIGVQPGFFAWVDGAPAEGYRAPRWEAPPDRSRGR